MLLALNSGHAGEIFETEAIPGSLLRMQSSQKSPDQQPSLYVNNLDMESLLSMTRKPKQSVLVEHTGSGYAAWNRPSTATGESTKLTLDFSVLEVPQSGALIFGAFRGDLPLERRNVPEISAGLNSQKKLVLCYGNLANNDWKELPCPPLTIGKTYRALIRIDNDKQGLPTGWSVQFLDGARVIASQERIPMMPGPKKPFSGVFLQSNSKDPFLVERVSMGGATGETAVADFQAPGFSKDANLSGQGGWTGSAADKIRVVETAKAVIPYMSATPDFRVYLSKDRYAAEDGHLDAVCVLPGRDSETADLVVNLRLLSADDRVLAEKKGFVPPSTQFAVYWSLPAEAFGKAVKLDADFRNKKTGESAKVQMPFWVEAAKKVQRQGDVTIEVPGNAMMAGSVIPQSVGVPFPKGALTTEARLRLVDENGKEIPAAFRMDGRWNRFGSVRWVNCAFALPVSRQAQKLRLQFGLNQGGTSLSLPGAATSWDGAFTGQFFRIAKEISVEGKPLMRPESLSGNYVIDGGGKVFQVNPSQKFTVEQSDSQQTILRQQGWYEASDKTRFCQFDNRITLFKNAPWIRVEHAWTFTGDGNKDTISEMGWRFSAAGAIIPGGFCKPDGEWIAGSGLLQHDFNKVSLRSKTGDAEMELRSPGIARVQMDNGKDAPSLLFAVKDFWQNYPAELVVDKQSFSVLTWPGNGREGAGPATNDDFHRLKFIHTGKNLNFRLPDEYLKPPLYSGTEPHYLAGKAESANAQGISKTTEMWITTGRAAETSALAQSLCDRSLSAFVDPDWLVASGVFHEIHAKDTKDFPQEEAVYESVALAPERWTERMSVYGKWIWGGVLSSSNLVKQTTFTFRTFRKAHQGWPYSWLPYARSGDVRFRRFAEANTRQMADVNFCRYSDDKSPRPLGFWNRSLIPWTFIYGPTSRHYADKVDYLWHAWHLAGDYRAQATANLWAAATKTDKMPILPWSGNRRSVNMLRTYVDAYQESLDPWFIPAYREVAKLHEGMAAQSPAPASYQLGGASFWSSGPREYLRFTGDPSYRALYLSYANYWGGEGCDNVWVQFGVPMLEPLSFAYQLTHDPYYAKRIRGKLDWADEAVYEGPEEWMKGYNITGKDSLAQAPLFAGYFLSHFPFAEQVLAESKIGAESIPDNIYVLPGFNARPTGKGESEFIYPRIYVEKAAAKPIPLFFDLQFPGKDTGPWTYQVRGGSDRTILEGRLDSEAHTTRKRSSPARPSKTPEGESKVEPRPDASSAAAVVTQNSAPPSSNTEGESDAESRLDASSPVVAENQDSAPSGSNTEGESGGSVRPNSDRTPKAEIPVSAPAGSYTVDVRHDFPPATAQTPWGHGAGLMIPISPNGIREVISWPRGRYLPPFSFQSQLWFRWPGNEQILTLRTQYYSMANETQHPMVKNAAGEVIWEKEFLSDPQRKGQVLTCRLDRARFGPDGMVQVIFPGRDVHFAVDGEGDLFYAVSPQRWFQPSSSTPAEPRKARELPVAVVGTGKNRPSMEETLTHAGVWIDKSVSGNILNPADYGQYSAIVFEGGGVGECAWDKLENREQVRQWISNGGIAVVIGLNSVPRQSKPQLDLQGLDEFLGFSKAVNVQANAPGYLQLANAQIFQSLPAAQREKGILWNRRIAAAAEITSAEILAQINSLGAVTVNRIGKGKIYYFGCEIPNPKENVPDVDTKALYDVIIAALKP